MPREIWPNLASIHKIAAPGFEGNEEKEKKKYWSPTFFVNHSQWRLAVPAQSTNSSTAKYAIHPCWDFIMKQMKWDCGETPSGSILCPATAVAHWDEFQSSMECWSHLAGDTLPPSLSQSSFVWCTFLWVHKLPQTHGWQTETKELQIPGCWRFLDYIREVFCRLWLDGSHGGSCNCDSVQRCCCHSGILHTLHRQHNTNAHLYWCAFLCFL